MGANTDLLHWGDAAGDFDWLLICYLADLIALTHII
jgi:hypothetical protein